jgi:hypothetical protein
MGAPPVTARRAKRENGGLGEEPPGRTMLLFISGGILPQTFVFLLNLKRAGGESEPRVERGGGCVL